MISIKLATLAIIKIKVFWSKGYDVIISVHDITNKILSRELNYVVDVAMWPKFGRSYHNFREKKYEIWEKFNHNLNFIRILPEKPLFLRGGSSSIICDWH